MPATITRRRDRVDKQHRPTWAYAYVDTDTGSQQLEMLESNPQYAGGHPPESDDAVRCRAGD